MRDLTDEAAELYNRLRKQPVPVNLPDQARKRLLGELGYTEHNIIELMSLEGSEQ